MSNYNDLFDGNLDGSMSFLEDKKQVKNDGLLRIDMSKVKDPKVGYKVTLRFLPNFTKDNKRGEVAIEKISHFVNTPDMPELRGFYDSPKNFGQSCELSTLYYTLSKSNNAILQAKASQLQWSKKYYSYVLVIDDTCDPSNNGKIKILQYGKTIREKILAEKNGENIDGIPTNVFSIENGKDFVLTAKEIQTGNQKFPDYKSSFFKQSTPLSIYNDEKGKFTNVPLDENGKIPEKYRGKIVEFLQNREFELEDFAPKPLTEEQQAKVTEIVNYLSGKTSATFKKNQNSDFNDLDDIFTDSATMSQSKSSPSNDDDDDDFFSDL